MGDEEVLGVLAEARTLGFLGPGAIKAHVAHASVFAEALREGLQAQAGDGIFQALDLGSGGGVPGLLLARWFPELRWVLLDVHRRRTSFLTHAVAQLGWVPRVEVVRADAAEAARDRDLRGQCQVVTSRSFGPPASAAECGVGFLSVGGRLLVADPPEAPVQRWPTRGLARLGLRDEGVHRSPAGTVRSLTLVRPVKEDFPRARRTMEQHPLW